MITRDEDSDALAVFRRLSAHWQQAATWMMGSTHPDQWQRSGASYLRRCADELDAAVSALQQEKMQENHTRVDTTGLPTDSLTAPADDRYPTAEEIDTITELMNDKEMLRSHLDDLYRQNSELRARLAAVAPADAPAPQLADAVELLREWCDQERWTDTSVNDHVNVCREFIAKVDRFENLGGA